MQSNIHNTMTMHHLAFEKHAKAFTCIYYNKYLVYLVY